MRRILFLTGTRADFGKLKPLIRRIEADPEYEVVVFVTGMHMLERYGYTVNEVHKEGFKNVYMYMNQHIGAPMDIVLATTIEGLSRYVAERPPDMIVVHGDRVETLAGAIVGSLRNIRVGHVEGGERSGAVDEMIRHSVSKLAHVHFVANDEAASRLRQLGEDPVTIHVIGSPDIDVMLSPNLPTLANVQQRYEIPFSDYAVVLYHPVTTEVHRTAEVAAAMVQALVRSDLNYVVIYPNNDEGTASILPMLQQLRSNPRFKLFPSLRFEHFLSLLKHSRFIIGNSSAGIREAPVYGVRTVNVGSRQAGRFDHESILNVADDEASILVGIEAVRKLPAAQPCHHFGSGDSATLFKATLDDAATWRVAVQKRFHDA